MEFAKPDWLEHKEGILEALTNHLALSDLCGNVICEGIPRLLHTINQSEIDQGCPNPASPPAQIRVGRRGQQLA